MPKLAERDCMLIGVKSPRIISNGFRESMDKDSALTELVGIRDLSCSSLNRLHFQRSQRPSNRSRISVSGKWIELHSTCLTPPSSRIVVKFLYFPKILVNLPDGIDEASVDTSL